MAALWQALSDLDPLRFHPPLSLVLRGKWVVLSEMCISTSELQTKPCTKRGK
jgi:hypothetical protein